MTAFAAITSERNETSRRANAKKSTNANTTGADLFIAGPPVHVDRRCARDAVLDVVERRRAWRGRCLRAGSCTPDSDAASLPLPASGTVIVSAVLLELTSVSIEPSVTMVAARALAEISNRRLNLWSVDVRRLQDDRRGMQFARKRLLDAVVGLDRLEVLRQRLRRDLNGLHAERRDRERDEQRLRRRPRTDPDARARGRGSSPRRGPRRRLAEAGAATATRPLSTRSPSFDSSCWENRQRSEHRDRDDHDRSQRERREARVAGEEHACHRDHDCEARDRGSSVPTSPPRPRAPPTRCDRLPVPRVRV